MTSFIKFPDALVAIPGYPGYCWHTLEHKLYSYKSGELKPMKMSKASHWNSGFDCYHVSRYGVRRSLLVMKLMKIQVKPTIVDYNIDGRV